MIITLLIVLFVVSCSNKMTLPSPPNIVSGVYIAEHVEDTPVTEDDEFVIEEVSDPFTQPGSYPSNSIGQIRDESRDGYTITVISPTQYNLLKDNTIVKRIETTEQGGTSTRRESDSNGKFLNFSRYDKNGNLIEYINEDRSYDILSFDSQNRLISVKSYTFDNIETRNCVYYRDPKTGSVLGIKDNDNYSFFTVSDNSDLMITGNENRYDVYETFFGTVTLKNSSDNKEESYEISYAEDGCLVVTRNNNKTIYSPEGRILEDNGKKYNYTSDGLLDYTEETINDVLVKEYYTDAMLTKREEFQDEIPVRTLVYKTNTIETTLFENGKEYATITYDGDGYKVLNIKYYNNGK